MFYKGRQIAVFVPFLAVTVSGGVEERKTDFSVCFFCLICSCFPFPIRFVAGVVPRERIPAFERMLWFACRGNVFMRHEPIDRPIEDPATVSFYCQFCWITDRMNLTVHCSSCFMSLFYPCCERQTGAGGGGGGGSGGGCGVCVCVCVCVCV